MSVGSRNLIPYFGVGGYLPELLPAHFSDANSHSAYFTDQDSLWMFEALREGMTNHGFANPNPNVGCVIVKDGKVIARGATEAYTKRHAERVAIESLKNQTDLEGATAYVTLEPCAHQGHQPSCADFLAKTKLSRVVIARLDPNPKTNGSGVKILEKSGKKTTSGILSGEATAWHLPFLGHQILGRPILVAKWAQSLDGHLADDSGNSKWITGPFARAYGHLLRQRYDSILVGAGTVLADRPALSVRDIESIKNQPLRIIVDPKQKVLTAETSVFEGLLQTTFAPGSPIAFITSATIAPEAKANFDKMQNISKVKFLFLKKSLDFSDSLIELLRSKELDSLLGRPLQSVFVEGGPNLLNQLLSKSYVDIAHTFIAPIVIGGTKNRITLAKSSPLNKATRLNLLAQIQLGPDVVLESHHLGTV